MPELLINGQPVSAGAGTTVLEAAASLGIRIPTMCHHGSLPHFASCMVCVVKDQSQGRLLTACSVAVADGMEIITLDEEIREARKTALELLLSDHTGDCEAPCQISCPAHMDIPEMNRLLAEGRFEEAYSVVLRDIPLPSVLGMICPAPCEGACRRKSVDDPVSICLLKRYAGDHHDPDEDRFERTSGPDRPKVAVIGSGPHGLSAAWFLQSFGYQCTVYDRNPLPGGALRYSVPRDRLPLEALDREIGRIRNAGVEFRMECEIGPAELDQLNKSYSAVVYPLEKAPKMAIKALALGKEEAWKIRQRLTGLPETGEPRLFNSRFGKLTDAEPGEYLKDSVAGSRIEPSAGRHGGMSAEEVKAEAARCLHCDCRKKENCLLRIHSDAYGAVQKRFQGPDRRQVTRESRHDTVVYEPAKCIRCSICVRITEQYKEPLGLTFIGRGFEVQIGVPFSQSVREGLTHTATEAAAACPTGALALKKERR